MAMTVAERMRTKRARDKANGIVSKSDSWWRDNPDKHRDNTRKWRSENLDRSQEVNREIQARRRSTPWGKINNRMWPIVHYGVRARSKRNGKYTVALGYLWSELAEHLESQFTGAMSWENWGEVWELDHIKPLVLFKYETIECEEFKECWGLANLRPLLREENQRKGCR